MCESTLRVFPETSAIAMSSLRLGGSDFDLSVAYERRCFCELVRFLRAASIAIAIENMHYQRR